MAIFEQLGRMTYIDAVGNQHILYPVTKKECVEGLFSIEDAIGDIQKLETIDKSSLVAAINEARSFGGGNIETIQQELNKALEEAKLSGDFDGRGIVSVVRTGGNGAAGTTDEYTITYTDGTTSKFNIYNGANGVGDSSAGESGENGATFTPFLDSEGNLSWSNDKGLANPSTINIKGQDGYTPQKNIDYFDGKDGENGFSPVISSKEVSGGHEITILNESGSHSIVILDGVDGSDGKDGVDGISCSHSWDGTTLTITSASGTSSANLVGQAGRDGDDGVSIVDVSQTTTSSEDDGTNVVTISLSNGESFSINIKNGSKGAQGGDGNKGDPGLDATINGVNTLTLNTGPGLKSKQDGNMMTISANYEYGQEDLEAGVSALETGKLYFVYE